MDCDEAGKKLTLRVAAGSRKPFELVGLDQLAKLEAVEPEQPS